MIEYTLLAAERERFAEAAMPDGSTVRTASGSGTDDEMAAALRDKHRTQYETECEERETEQRRAQSSWDQAYRQWRKDAVDVTTKRTIGTKESMCRVSIGGSEPISMPCADVERYLTAGYADAHGPRPTLGELASFEEWSKEHNCRITVRRGWTIQLTTGDNARSSLGFSERWPDGVPQEMLTHLNRLTEDGWRLRHISEDRGIYSGADANREAGVTRIRMWLERSVEK